MFKFLKEHFKKPTHFLFDFVLAILIIAVIILADILIIKLKSNPAEDKYVKTELPASTDGSTRLTMTVSAGEKVFIPILNFHHIDKAPANLSKFDQGFYIEPDKFATILNDLINNDYRPVFMSEIVGDLEAKKLSKEKIMAITFDDGNEDFYTKAWPILQKLKIKSNVYVMTGVRGANWLTPEQMIELDKSGLVEIGSHTVWHPYLKKVSKERQWQELIDSKKFLDKLLNKSINVICYPFGMYNQQIEDLAKQAGYEAGLTFDQDAWQPADNLLELKRISVYPGLDVIKFLEKLKNNK